MKQRNNGPTNPWLSIPWEDYEGHMASPQVGQAQFLSGIFKNILQEYKPQSIVVLGCTTGNGFEHIEPNMTQTVVGVDLNPYYLNVLQSRFAKKIQDLRLICEDLATCELESGSYDIVHCALTLEYVEPRTIIAKSARWLRLNGTLVIVLQLPSEKSGKVSETKYESLKGLEPIMMLVEPEEVQRLTAEAGLTEIRSDMHILESQKTFFIGHYMKISNKR